MAIKKPNNEYRITVVGKQRGINIPANHRYVVLKGEIGRNADDSGYNLWIEIYTYKDSNHTTILYNDLFPSNKLPFLLGATLPTRNIQSVTATELEKWLDKNIGIDKWTKIK